MTAYTDDFNRANGAPGSNWTAINGGTWTIASNTLTQTQSTGVYRGLRWNGGALASNDFYAQVTARAPSGVGFGVLVRCPTTGTAEADIDGYAIVGFVGDQWYRIEFTNGSDAGYIGLGGTVAASTDYTIEVRANGSTVSVYVGGSQLASWTDTTYTTGGAMLITYGGTVTFDNFEVADLATGVVGSAALTQAGQTAAAAGVVAVVGAASLTQAGQTVAATGTAPAAGITGAASLTQAGQTVAGAGAVAVVGAASITQGGNGVTLPQALRFYGNAVDQIDRVRIPLEDGVSVQYPPNVGAGDFTVEAWLRCAYADNGSTATDEDARYSNIVYDRDSWGEQRGHVWGVTRSGTSLVVCFGQAGSGGGWATIFSTSNIGDDEWHHVAVTRNQATGQVRIWVDGVAEASGTYDTTDWSFPAGHTVGSGQDNEYAVIGTEKHDVGYGYNGQIDELRISDTLRYTATFTPARRFDPDADAVGLYHADEGSGTVLADFATVAGAPTHGELLVGGSPAGPVWVELPAGVVESVAGIVGSAAITQDGQTLAAVGVVAIVGSAAITQGGQTVVAAGVVVVVGTSSITQDSQTLEAAGYVGNVPIVGIASLTQDSQTVSAAGVVAVAGIASLTQDGQTVAATGAVAIVGSAASITQDGQTVAATAALDLVLAVVFGAVLGVRAAGAVVGSQATGAVRGSRATGSM